MRRVPGTHEARCSSSCHRSRRSCHTALGRPVLPEVRKVIPRRPGDEDAGPRLRPLPGCRRSEARRARPAGRAPEPPPQPAAAVRGSPPQGPHRPRQAGLPDDARRRAARPHPPQFGGQQVGQEPEEIRRLPPPIPFVRDCARCAGHALVQAADRGRVWFTHGPDTRRRCVRLRPGPGWTCRAPPSSAAGSCRMSWAPTAEFMQQG